MEKDKEQDCPKLLALCELFQMSTLLYSQSWHVLYILRISEDKLQKKCSKNLGMMGGPAIHK